MSEILGRPVPVDQLSRWPTAGGPIPDADVFVALISASTGLTVDELDRLLGGHTPMREKPRRIFRFVREEKAVQEKFDADVKRPGEGNENAG